MKELNKPESHHPSVLFESLIKLIEFMHEIYKEVLTLKNELSKLKKKEGSKDK